MESGGRVENEPSWLTRLRARYMEYYRALPVEVSQLYVRHYEAPELSEQSLGEMLERESGGKIPEAFRYVVDNTEQPSVIFVNGKLSHLCLPERLARQGVEISPIPEAFKTHEEFFREHYSQRLQSHVLDKFSSLNNALFATGIFIRVADNLEVDTPIRILWILDGDHIASIGQTFILTGSNSSVSVIEEAHGEGDGPGLLSHLVEIVQGSGGRLRHSTLQNLPPSKYFLDNRVLNAGTDSDTNIVGALLGSKISKSRVDNILSGNGSRVNDLEIVFGDGEQRIDLTSNLHHIGYGTQGRVLAKGVAKDSSKTLFKGVITIGSKAKNTSAYLAEHAMIISPEARAYAIPSLEIETDEVKATHSASVSQIDQEQIYYLMSRGIPEPEARKMITMGFFEPVVSMIDLDIVRWGLRSLLEGKWGGAFDELFEEGHVTVTELFAGHYKYRWGKQ